MSLRQLLRGAQKPRGGRPGAPGDGQCAVLCSSARTALAMDGLQVGEYAIKVSIAKSNLNNPMAPPRAVAAARMAPPPPRSLPPPRLPPHRPQPPHAQAGAGADWNGRPPNGPEPSGGARNGGYPSAGRMEGRGGASPRGPDATARVQLPGPPRPATLLRPPDERTAQAEGRMLEGRGAAGRPDLGYASDRDIAHHLLLDLRRPSDRRRIEEYRKSGGQQPPAPAAPTCSVSQPYSGGSNGGSGRQSEDWGMQPGFPSDRRRDDGGGGGGGSRQRDERGGPSGLAPDRRCQDGGSGRGPREAEPSGSGGLCCPPRRILCLWRYPVPGLLVTDLRWPACLCLRLQNGL